AGGLNSAWAIGAACAGCLNGLKGSCSEGGANGTAEGVSGSGVEPTGFAWKGDGIGGVVGKFAGPGSSFSSDEAAKGDGGVEGESPNGEGGALGSEACEGAGGTSITES